MAPRSLINQMFGLLRHCHEASILSTLECEVKVRSLAVTAAGQIRNDHSPFREYSIHTAATRQLSNGGPRLPELQFILCLPPQPYVFLITLHLSLIDCIGRAAAFSPLQINKQPGRRVRPVAKKPDKDSARLALTLASAPNNRKIPRLLTCVGRLTSSAKIFDGEECEADRGTVYSGVQTLYCL